MRLLCNSCGTRRLEAHLESDGLFGYVVQFLKLKRSQWEIKPKALWGWRDNSGPRR